MAGLFQKNMFSKFTRLQLREERENLRHHIYRSWQVPHGSSSYCGL